MSSVERVPVRTRDGLQLALYRVRGGDPGRLPPVLLVPGTFTTRAFWLGPRENGFAWVLANAGFDTWILEPRGHGQSERPSRWTLHDWILRDAPAAVEAVLDATRAERCFWVGHSAGGVVGAAFAGTDDPMARRLQGLALLGSPGPGTMAGRRRWIARAAHAAAVLLPHVRIPGKPLGLGPEYEPAALVRQWMGWNLSGVWRDPDGDDYLARLGAVREPVLAVSGTGDRWLAPPHAVRDLLQRFGPGDRTLIVAGTETGFREDYDHAGLMVARSARDEIWPHVVEWLQQRSRP